MKNSEKIWDMLENDYKTELVGNLLASHGVGLGIRESFGIDVLTIPYAAKISLWHNGRELDLKEEKRVWHPAQLLTEYKTSGIRLIEKKSAWNNIVLSCITIESDCFRDLEIRVESVLFSSASTFDTKFIKGGFCAYFDNGLRFSMVSSRNFKRQGMHNQVKFRKKEWISKKSRRLLGDLPVKFSYIPEVGKNVEFCSTLNGDRIYVQQSFNLRLKPQVQEEITLGIEYSEVSGIVNFIREPDGFFKKARGGWDRFAAVLPRFDCSDRNLTKLFYYSFYVLKSNEVRINLPKIKERFTAASKFFYWGHFFWDSAFQAAGWQWLNEKYLAERELTRLIKHQWESGLIPAESFIFADPFFAWRSGKSTWITHPPVHPMVLREVFYKFGDRKFLKFMYERLLDYDDWLWYELDSDKDGLSSYRHIWETGWDDNQRWDGVSKDNMLDPWIESVDFNSLIYLNRKILLETGKLLGDTDKKRRSALLSRIRLMGKSFHEFWDKKDKFFYDITDREHQRIKVKTAAGFYPLLTGLLSNSRRKTILSHLLNPEEFWTPCPVPCTSADHPKYDPEQTWRGASWPNVTWLILMGLLMSKEEKIARELLKKFLGAISRKGKLVAEEYYDSQSGNCTVGVGHYGWSGVIIDMICRMVVGVNPKTGNKLCLNPLDIGLDWFELSGLKYKGKKLSIRWDKKGGYIVGIGNRAVARSKRLGKLKIEL